MTWLKSLLKSSVVSVSILGAASCAMAGDDHTGDTEPGNGFAVVELFTSEGCSSCPPADVAISKLVTQARKEGKAIYPLAFHVDYWNRLGWADRFSTAEATARQNAYAKALNLDQIYTPQTIVNGQAEFVGSDTARESTEIDKALAAKPAATVKMELTCNNDLLTVHFTTTHSAGEKLNVALVERGLETKVAAGENQGRTLPHDNVVRVFKTVDVPATEDGKVEITIPDKVKAVDTSVIVYVQDDKTMKIVAATATDVGK